MLSLQWRRVEIHSERTGGPVAAAANNSKLA